MCVISWAKKPHWRCEKNTQTGDFTDINLIYINLEILDSVQFFILSYFLHYLDGTSDQTTNFIKWWWKISSVQHSESSLSFLYILSSTAPGQISPIWTTVAYLRNLIHHKCWRMYLWSHFKCFSYKRKEKKKRKNNMVPVRALILKKVRRSPNTV